MRWLDLSRLNYTQWNKRNTPRWLAGNSELTNRIWAPTSKIRTKQTNRSSTACNWHCAIFCLQVTVDSPAGISPEVQ
jgi:hypothetical protein